MSESRPGGRGHSFEARESSRTPERGDAGRFEHQPVISARDALINTVAREFRGSPKVLAIRDWTKLEGAVAKLSLLDSQENPNGRALMEAIAEKAAIDETISNRRFGEDYADYRAAAWDATETFGKYYRERLPQSGESPLSTMGAADRLSKDLESINDLLPKKGEAPRKP